jgi:hypothetical protein
MDKWSTLQSTGGIPAIDDWEMSGSATYARSTTAVRKGRRYGVALTRSGSSGTLLQSVPALLDGVNSLVGKTVTLVALVNASTASQVRGTISAYTSLGSAISTSTTSYHTGSSLWEELTVEYTVPTGATTLQFGTNIVVDGTAHIAECYLMEGTLTDGVRLDAYKRTLLTKDDYVWNWPELLLENNASRGRLLITSGRPYPRFDSTRVLAGSADSDSSGAPLSLVSAGAIARLFEGLAQGQGNDTTRYRQIAAEWQARFNKMAQRHRYKRDLIDGVDMPVRQFASSPRGW